MITKTLTVAGDKTEPIWVPSSHRLAVHLKDNTAVGITVKLEWIQTEAGKDQHAPAQGDSRWNEIEAYTTFDQSKASEAGGAWFRAHLTAVTTGTVGATMSRTLA